MDHRRQALALSDHFPRRDRSSQDHLSVSLDCIPLEWCNAHAMQGGFWTDREIWVAVHCRRSGFAFTSRPPQIPTDYATQERRSPHLSSTVARSAGPPRDLQRNLLRDLGGKQGSPSRCSRLSKPGELNGFELRGGSVAVCIALGRLLQQQGAIGGSVGSLRPNGGGQRRRTLFNLRATAHRPLFDSLPPRQTTPSYDIYYRRHGLPIRNRTATSSEGGICGAHPFHLDCTSPSRCGPFYFSSSSSTSGSC